MGKPVGAYTGEPVQPMLARREESSGTGTTDRSTELLTEGVKMKDVHGVTLCIISSLKSTLELLHSHPVFLV